MEVSVKVVLDKRRKLKDGNYPIKLRVIFNRTFRQYKVTIDNENASSNTRGFGKIMSNNSKGSNKELRNALLKEEEKLMKLAKNISPFSFEDFEKVKDGIKNRKDWSLELAFLNKIETVENLGTAKSYSDALGSLRALERLEGAKLPQHRISLDYVKSWVNFMQKRGIRKPNSEATQGMFLRAFKHIVTAYDLESEKLFGKKKDNLIEIPISKPKVGRKALSIEEVRMIKSCKVSTETEQEAKDIWLFSYYCSGMNVFDIVLLKWEQIDLIEKELIFIRRKTSHTRKDDNVEITIQLNDSVIDIIERRGINDCKYVFGYITGKEGQETLYRIKNNLLSRVNNNIHKIGKSVKIPANKLKYLTSYSARHSYASVLKNKGEDIALISDQLGHTSIEITRTYLGLHDKKKIRAASKKLE